jgi:hypothetical protein
MNDVIQEGNGVCVRCRRPGEPHLVKGNWLLGSGADFAKDAVALLHSCAKQYGDIFTLRLLHQRITFVADVHSFDAFARHRQFDFDPIQRQVNWNVFGYVVLDPKRLVANSTNLLKGASLGHTLVRFANNLTVSVSSDSIGCLVCNMLSHWSFRVYCTFVDVQQEVISDLPVANDVNGNVMSQGGKLRDFLAETFFTAQFATMFGRDAEGQQFTARLAYENLEVFHRYFNYLWLGVPMYLFPPALRAIRSLSQQPTSDDFLARPDISDWLRAEIQVIHVALLSSYLYPSLHRCVYNDVTVCTMTSRRY